MSDITLNINGLDTVINNVKGIKDQIQKIMETEFAKYGTNTGSDAKRMAPVDEGNLRNKIAFVQKGLEVEITVGVNYAAYIEFGTRKFAAAYVSTLPSTWQVFAAQFQGKSGGGSFEEFVMRLTQWVLSKGIGSTFNIKTKKQERVGKQSKQTTAEADAYAIALYIIRNGIKPHPYLVPSVEKNNIILIANLKNQLTK